MFTVKRDIGKKFESCAAKFLRGQGCRVVEKNFHCRNGEIDLIVTDKSCLVFVEVKYRSNEQFGLAAEMVTTAKQQKLIRSAQYFLQKHNKYSLLDARFDVIGITHSIPQGDIKIDWIKGAFTT